MQLQEYMPDGVTLLSAGASGIEFTYKGEHLRLWIIVGGQPCIAIDEYYMPQRYPRVKRYAEHNWDFTRQCYMHQVRYADGTVTPPPTFDDLPNGLADVDAYLERALDRIHLRQDRIAQLPPGVIKSPRVHIPREHAYLSMTIRTDVLGMPLIQTKCRDDLDFVTYIDAMPRKWREVYYMLRTIRYNQRIQYIEDLCEQDYFALSHAIWSCYNTMLVRDL